MKKYIASALLGLAAVASLAPAAPAAAVRSVPAHAQVAQVPYLWATDLETLRIIVGNAELRGFAPVGTPRIRYVPEAGGRAWVQFITYVGL